MKRRICSFERLELRQMLAVTLGGSEFRVNDLVPRVQTIEAASQAVGITSSGGLISVYSGRGAGDETGVFVRRLAGDGSALAQSVRVNDYIAGVQSQPAVATIPSGGFIVAWAGRGLGDREGVYARWFQSSGVPLGEAVLVNTTTGGRQSRPCLAVAGDGSVVVAWQGVGDGDLEGVFFQRFAANATRAGTENRANATTNNTQALPSIATHADGHFIVSWSSRHQDGDDWGIYGRQFSASGAPAGAEFQVNQSNDGSQFDSSLAVRSDGSFAVAWSSRSEATVGWDLFNRDFDANNLPAGREQRINQNAEGNQLGVSLAALEANDLLVVWQTGVEDGSGWEVAARVVAPNQDSSDPEVIVNAMNFGPNSGHQLAPAVASSTVNAAVVVWSGTGSSDSHGVFGQRIQTEPANLPPDLAPISNTQATVGVEIRVNVTATDPNVGDQLAFFLDPDDAPTSAVLQQIDNTHAVIIWTPTASDLPGPITIRVLVTDNGTPVLSDAEQFQVALSPASTLTASATSALSDSSSVLAHEAAQTLAIDLTPAFSAELADWK